MKPSAVIPKSQKPEARNGLGARPSSTVSITGWHTTPVDEKTKYIIILQQKKKKSSLKYSDEM